MKRWIAFLLSLVMVLSLMPMAVMAEETAEQERLPITTLYVGTVNALETPQGDGWSFDAQSGVLTLNNCTLTESMPHVQTDEYGSYRYDAMIYFAGDLTVELIGTNCVERVIESTPADYTSYYAICGSSDIPDGWESPGALTFTGTGNLTTGIAVTADAASEDGGGMKDAWEYFEFSAGIGVWGGTDLSGLQSGGWMDIYGGIYGVEAPYIVKAFANYPTFGDNCIVTAYQDVEGTVENEYGYNWNNNDAWRMKVVTADAHLKSNGQLILMDSGSASGEGWTWDDSVLTLSADTAVKAVEFRRTVGSARLTLTGDVTLDATDMGYDANWNSISAVTAYCDLEIDAGDHTLTLHNSWADALRAELCDVTLSGGTVVTTNEGGYAMNMIGGDLTVQNATFRSATEIYLTEGYDADYNTIPAGDAVLDGAVVVLDSPITSYGTLTILSSDVTVTGGYDALYGNTAVTARDSTLSIDATGHALTSNSAVTVDNCNLNLTAEEAVIYHGYYHYEWNDESNIPDTTRFLLQNMDITQPESWSVQLKQTDADYYTMYEVLVVDGDGNPATTLVATAAGNEHEHSYENGICSCGAKQTFTVTWKNADGTVLELDTVEYGDRAEYNGETPTKTGVGYDYTFRCWSNGVQYVDITNFVVTGDWTFTAVYTNTVHKHDLIFMDGDLELARKTLDYNKYTYASSLNSYAGNPTKACYTLTGWAYADGTAAGAFWMPDENVVLYAVWDGPNHSWVDATCAAPKTCSGCGLTEGEALEHTYTEGVCSGCGAIQTFTVTWVNWDGTVLEVDTVEYGVVPEYNGETPTRPNVGYDFTFNGWGIGSMQTTPGPATKDVTYTAYYTSAVHKHDLVFLDDDGVTELARYETHYDKRISAGWLTTAAGNPTKEGYILTGWTYPDGSSVSDFYMPDNDVTFVAVWTPDRYTVHFDANEGSFDPYSNVPQTDSTYSTGDPITTPKAYRTGYTLVGYKFYTDSACSIAYTGSTGTMPAQNLWAVAQWEINFYGITFYPEGGTFADGTTGLKYVKYEYNTPFLDQLPEISRDCYTFEGWKLYTTAAKDFAYTGSTEAMPARELHAVARWSGPNHTDADSDTDHSCDVCGAENITEHSYTAVITAPTCTEAGFTTYTCACGDSYVADEVAALGHSYETVVTAPTCTEGGYTTYTCACGDSYVADEVAALDHSYETVTVDAICTAPGSITDTCVNCGDTQVQSIPATGHSHEAVVTAPTCTQKGYTTYTCHCGDSYVTDEIAAQGHNHTTQILYPTCTENGSITVTCDRCSEQLIGTVAATGHSYENGKCTACGEVDPDVVTPVVKPTLTLKAPALEFKDMIKVIAFYTAENIEDVVEMGMITYNEQVDVIDINTADHVIPGAEYEASSGRYFSSSQGIHAKYLVDTVYLACYAKLTDGSYVYTKLAPYSAITYANSQLKGNDMNLKQLVVSMLNYGAAAQMYFSHNVENLANAILTEDQLALPESYRDDMVTAVPTAPTEKQGIFANNQGFSSRRPAVSFEGAFSINYFFTPTYAPVDGITLYYWNEADYHAVEVLTVENASGRLQLEGSGTEQYRGDIEGISAKNLSQAVYVAAVYSDGTTTWTSGVLGYSIGAYCSSLVAKGGTIADLAMATAVYGYHARQYFGS